MSLLSQEAGAIHVDLFCSIVSDYVDCFSTGGRLECRSDQ